MLRQVCPDAQIHLASALPRWFGAERFKLGRASPSTEDSLDMIEYGDYDIFVSAGMVLCEEYGRILGPSLAKASARGKKVMFLGAGGAYYDDREREAFLKALKGVNVIGFRSRDPLSYGSYREDFPNSTSGIDCAWHLPDAYEPLDVSLGDYCVSAFHNIPEPPEIAANRSAIRTYHYLLDPVPGDYLLRGRYCISDRPEDYLNLYAAARVTHTDLVHATVATLVYGREARFYGSTLRASLFASVGAEAVCREITTIDQDRLSRLKRSQAEWTRSLLEPLARARAAEHRRSIEMMEAV